MADIYDSDYWSGLCDFDDCPCEISARGQN